MTETARSIARILGVAGLGIALAAALAWYGVGGAVGLVESRLPAFPDWPPAPPDFSAGGQGELRFVTYSPYDFDILLRKRPLPVPTIGLGTLVLPQGASGERPVPAVVLVHGSGGIARGREMRVARTLAEAGIAGFVVDYYRPRGVTPETDYMTKVMAVTEYDAATDAYAALGYLATHPAIDGSRVGMMGFSYGGMAVRIAMDERVREAVLPDHPGFAAFVDTYGPCFQDWGTQRVNGAPLLTLRGTEDASNDLAACAARESALRALGVKVDARIYEGAGHAWENEAPRRLSEQSPYVAGCTVRYDEQGFSWLGDVSIVSGTPRDSRAERVAARLATGGPLANCVGYGYVIGRDDETRERATRAFLEFFDRTLRPGRTVARRG